MSYTALIRIAFVFPLMRSLFRFLGGRGARQLVGPPHPISHIRPILYDTASRPPTDQTHPYSLSEFTDGTEDSLELQLRIEQQRLYLFNHEFWLDSNTRFLQGKDETLKQWQSRGDTSQESKENALSDFYARWSLQESTRQAEYTREWNRRNRLVIKLAMRNQVRRWKEITTSAFLG